MRRYADLGPDGGSGVLAQVAEQARQTADRLGDVRKVVAVMSGKGGVGKSSVTAFLASALQESGAAVGMLDADMNGASIARMTGTLGGRPAPSSGGVEPIPTPDGVRVMSLDYFVAPGEPVRWDAPTQRDGYTWRGMMEAAALRELVADTCWGALDLLLIDLPPGTDRLPNLTSVLPRLDGILVVCQPTRLAEYVVGRSIRTAHDVLAAPILGIVENMGHHVCSDCGREEPLFDGPGLAAWAAAEGLDVLARLPFDTRVARSADAGAAMISSLESSPTAAAYRLLAQTVTERLATEVVTESLST